MEDIQNRPDHREIPIDKVGVRNLRYPIVVLDRQRERQSTVANISMSVSLPHHFKGTHMSRFLEILNEHRGEITLRTLPQVLDSLRTRLEAESAHVEVSFPFFVEVAAPVSGSKALMDYECSFVAESSTDKPNDYLLRVKVPVTSLCPCSKEISDYGAHNQRGILTLDVRCLKEDQMGANFVWFEELIDIAEESGSCRLYPLLKRPDERYVTMAAYDNPVFVEDMVRNVAAALQSDGRIAWFHVRAENEESIHNHNAFAEIEWSRPK